MLTTCTAMLFALSLHIGTVHDANAVHPTAGVACDSWSAGAYYNSDRRTSAWAAYRWSGDVAFAELGAVTGYEQAQIAPLARAGLSFPGVEFFAAPGISKHDEPLVIVAAVLTFDL